MINSSNLKYVLSSNLLWWFFIVLNETSCLVLTSENQEKIIVLYKWGIYYGNAISLKSHDNILSR